MTATGTAGGSDGPARPAVLCEGLVRIFRTADVEVQALQGLDLHLDHGEFVAVVGASGSGKSTLLAILSGLDAPTAGRVEVAGVDLTGLRGAQRVRYQREVVGFVWQQTSRNLLPYLTAAENVGLPLVLSRVKAAERARRAAELLDLLGVGDRAGHRPSELSGGEQQRVALAVALANRPAVLLADEPTGELDEATSHDVFDAIRSANRELGVTVLVVTHDALVSEQVDRTVAIRDGRTATEVLRRTRLDEQGRAELVAEEYAVLDRAGRLQLPHEFVTSLGLQDRVRLELEADHVGVWPGQREDGHE
ncbi:MAG TPA: ABC transporter ATP-binding protein [Kineosporiaceae bacterium]|jgi:ABC-type lipoprotein export system ATPase subunit|nr:ABC transporter ATP-binding protein [Kineosporiaceae bacterium]